MEQSLPNPVYGAKSEGLWDDFLHADTVMDSRQRQRCVSFVICILKVSWSIAFDDLPIIDVPYVSRLNYDEAHFKIIIVHMLYF